MLTGTRMMNALRSTTVRDYDALFWQLQAQAQSDAGPVLCVGQWKHDDGALLT